MTAVPLREFRELTLALLDEDDMTAVLGTVTEAAHEMVPGADLVSVTLRERDGHLYTPARTSPVAAALDQVQYDHDDGPSVEAARAPGCGYRMSGDLSAERSWPAFSAATYRYGYASVLSASLLPAPPRLGLGGALTIYGRRRYGLDGRSRDIALLLATHASLAVAATRIADQFHQAIEARDLIGQVKGILMERRGVSADEAFALLSRASQHLNIKLSELASRLAAQPGALDLL
ncbi:ANTAR domain-containing protein [Actinocorallia longicatena]|uniref:GAF and ANTAR domain-containing protein n=1 Tax=Actinocorallia longicatena TaxID=111803 RepID=A0ABP6QIS4_9ACTN